VVPVKVIGNVIHTFPVRQQVFPAEDNHQVVVASQLIQDGRQVHPVGKDLKFAFNRVLGMDVLNKAERLFGRIKNNFCPCVQGYVPDFRQPERKAAFILGLFGDDHNMAADSGNGLLRVIDKRGDIAFGKDPLC